MRKFLACAVTAFLIFFALPGRAQNFESPGEYNNYIMQQHSNVVSKFLAYNSAVSHGKRAGKVEKLREKLLDEVQESKMNITGMPKLKGDGAYRDTAANFLKFYYNVLNDDYSKIVNMEEIAEQSYDEMEAYLMMQEAVDKKLEEVNERMKNAQKEFAAKNNMTLVSTKDENAEKMKQVGDVNEYYHQVYLIFFRPYLQEENMNKAMDKANISGLEQDKNSLLKYSQDGLIKLEAVKAFNGDNSLKAACKQMLQYYVKEVNDYMKPVTEYFLTKERFESIKKDFENKSDHSKDEVNAYNKAVNDINSISGRYNEALKNLNEAGKENLDNWNKTVNEFFDGQMPK